MRYLLDTNICIYVARHRSPGVRARFERHAARDLSMSVVTFGEMRVGAERSQQPERAFQSLEQLCRMIRVEPMPEAAGRHYGEILADLQRRGCPIGGNDLWIAAHARAEDWTLVTNNAREFERVAGLRIENWAEGA